MENQEKQTAEREKATENKSDGEKERLDREAYFKIVKPLRTYERDVAENVREKGSSLVSIHMEERKSDNVAKKPKKKSFRVLEIKNILIVFLALIMLVAGGFMISQLLSITKSSPKEKPDAEVSSLFRADLIRVIDITNKNKGEIISALREELSIPLSSRRIIYFRLMEKGVLGESLAVNSQKTFTLLTPAIPKNLLRALGPITNIGILKDREVTDFFIISEIESFENAFAGMLGWEKTLKEDLKPLITSEEDGQTTIFQDAIIRNKDIRILRDESGKSVVLYSFVDKNILLIAKNEETFREVLDRYLVLKLSR